MMIKTATALLLSAVMGHAQTIATKVLFRNQPIKIALSPLITTTLIFPSPLAGTFGLGRRWHVPLATTLVVAMIGLSYASQLLTLGSFFT